MAKCQKCAMELPEGAVYCHLCGAKQEPIPEPPAAEEPAKPRKPEPHSRGSCIVGIACLLFIVVAIIWGFIALGREARELQRLSDETGLSVERLQQLEDLAVATGADFDELVEGAKHLAEVMEDAQ